MGSAMLEQAVEIALRMGEAVPLQDKEYVISFALRTGDKELTDKLASELAVPDADREAVCQRFGVMAGHMPGWISDIEGLLAAIGIYGAQEGNALKALEGFLSAYGVDFPTEKAHGCAGRPEETLR